jgi:hypothetical protein
VVNPKSGAANTHPQANTQGTTALSEKRAREREREERREQPSKQLVAGKQTNNLVGNK